MRAKPNTDQFKPQKDPSAFLEGGAADAADRTERIPNSIVTASVATIEPVISTKVHREQKVFRLPLDVINALKRESYERSVATGSRVTETELVEQALRKYISI
jgi:hypothetical protein